MKLALDPVRWEFFLGAIALTLVFTVPTRGVGLASQAKTYILKGAKVRFSLKSEKCTPARDSEGSCPRNGSRIGHFIKRKSRIGEKTSCESSSSAKMEAVR